MLREKIVGEGLQGANEGVGSVVTGVAAGGFADGVVAHAYVGFDAA